MLSRKIASVKCQIQRKNYYGRNVILLKPNWPWTEHFRVLFTVNVKGLVQRFSQQVLIKLYFLLNSENRSGTCCRFREKSKSHSTPTHSNSEKMTSPCCRVANDQQRSVLATICKFDDFIFELLCLQMVAETDFYWLLAKSSTRWRHFFGIGVCRSWAVLTSFSKTTARICAKFFSGFRRKHLFITTYCEKRCTGPLNFGLITTYCVKSNQVFKMVFTAAFLLNDQY